MKNNISQQVVFASRSSLWQQQLKSKAISKTVKASLATQVILAGLLLVTGCEKQPPEMVGGTELSNSVISPIEVDPSKLNTPSEHSEDIGTVTVPLSCRNSLIVESYKAQTSGVQVKGCGQVKVLLDDDNEGSRHQRFIVELEGVEPSHTVLIAHNIDLAPRINALQQGDDVVFYGQYEYNLRGGVVHWTHHDPAARHQDGWIEHKGQRFE